MLSSIISFLLIFSLIFSFTTISATDETQEEIFLFCNNIPYLRYSEDCVFEDAWFPLEKPSVKAKAYYSETKDESADSDIEVLLYKDKSLNMFLTCSLLGDDDLYCRTDCSLPDYMKNSEIEEIILTDLDVDEFISYNSENSVIIRSQNDISVLTDELRSAVEHADENDEFNPENPHNCFSLLIKYKGINALRLENDLYYTADLDFSVVSGGGLYQIGDEASKIIRSYFAENTGMF